LSGWNQGKDNGGTVAPQDERVGVTPTLTILP
jgi:hypothetical protein